MLYYSLEIISEAYGMPYGTLTNYVFKGQKRNREKPWREIRDRIEGGVIQEIYKVHKKNSEEVFGLTIHCLKRGLTALTSTDRSLSLDEMQKLSAIATDVQSIIRLENGQATEIIENIDISRDSIKAMIDELAIVDPYVNYQLTERAEEAIEPVN